ARCISTGHALWIGRKDRKVAVPADRQLSLLHLFNLGRQLGIFLAIRREQFRPLLPSVVATVTDSCCEMLVHAIRDKELCILRPSIGTLHEADFIVAEWFAMRSRRVLFVRRTVSDVAVKDDECGFALSVSESVQRLLDAVHIVCVADAQHIPPIS